MKCGHYVITKIYINVYNVPKTKILQKILKSKQHASQSSTKMLTSLTQIEEMLIARVSSNMYVYTENMVFNMVTKDIHAYNLLQDIQSRLDKLPQKVCNLPILILRRTGCNDICIGWIRIPFNYLGLA